MPSVVVPRGNRFGARRAGKWIGTFDSPEAARAASEAACAPAPAPRRRKVTVPTREEVEALCGRLDGSLGRMARVSAFSGLRLSEAAALTSRDLIFQDGGIRLKVRCGKGGKPRVSVLLMEGTAAVSTGAWGMPDPGLLFPRRDGGAWTRKTVNRRWVVARRDLGLEHVRYHDLRHFHATMLLDRGVSVLDVAIQLGHADNGELVRSTYGHPDAGAALDRVASIAGDHDA